MKNTTKKIKEKRNYYIEYSKSQQCIHISEVATLCLPNPEWELVEIFFGTALDASAKGNTHKKSFLANKK